MGDIGSHWCDMAEHVTGQRINSLCADLQTFHKTRKRPKVSVETFAGKTLSPEDYDLVPIDTEDFGSVIFRMGERARGAFTASQVSAGRKNRLNIEIYGTKMPFSQFFSGGQALHAIKSDPELRSSLGRFTARRVLTSTGRRRYDCFGPWQCKILEHACHHS